MSDEHRIDPESVPEPTFVEAPSADPRAFRMTLRRTSQGKIIGHHPRVREVLDTIERVAGSNCNVLVTGESGTGKELVVAALHDASSRAQGPLVPVNCGAIPETLLESALFGSERGAYTGALTREGYVAAAEGGTLFLDEVGELPLAVQVKLLRLLQQREYTPVGAARPVKCNIRVVAATNRDLEAEVREKRFREDLYYRLYVVHVHLPPLRERGADVEALALYFLQHCAARVGREGLAGYQPEALAALRAWQWPGNIRELENAVERAVVMARGSLVGLADLPRPLREHYANVVGAPAPTAPPPEAPGVPLHLPESGLDLRAAVEAYENSLILQALERTGGNRKQAAVLLQLNRTTLVEMIKRKNLMP